MWLSAIIIGVWVDLETFASFYELGTRFGIFEGDNWDNDLKSY